MGLLDSIKNVFASTEDEYEEEFEEQEEQVDEEPREKREKEAPRLFRNDRSKVVSYGGDQMQIVLCKPETYEDSPGVADNLRQKKTVILNLESANREHSRRIIDFLSGVAYAMQGTLKKVSNSTYVVTYSKDVNLIGELLYDDFDSDNMYL